MEWNLTLTNDSYDTPLSLTATNHSHPTAGGGLTPSSPWSPTSSSSSGQSNLSAEVRIVLYSVIFLLAFVGNTLVIATLFQNRRMRTLTNVLLLNLSISDLLLAVFCMPFTLIPTLLKNFIFGKTMCVLVRYMQGVSVGVSVFTLVAICLERYYAICRPLSSRRWQTLSHSYKMIFVVWSSAIALMVPVAVYQRILTLPNGALKCVEVWNHKVWEKVYTICLDVILLAFPMVVMTTAYSLISYTLWPKDIGAPPPSEDKEQQPRPSVDRSHDDKQSFSRDTDAVLQPTGTRYVYTRKRKSDALHAVVRMRQSSYDKCVVARRRVVKMLLVIVLEFFVCWTPMYVLQTWIVFDYQGAVSRVSAVVMNLIHLLAFLSSCCHPITYCFMNKTFRRGFQTVFRCCPFDRERRREYLGRQRSTYCSADHHPYHYQAAAPDNISLQGISQRQVLARTTLQQQKMVIPANGFS